MVWGSEGSGISAGSSAGVSICACSSIGVISLCASALGDCRGAGSSAQRRIADRPWGFLDRVEHRLRMGGLGHDIRLLVDPVVNMRAVAAQLLQQLDRLGRLLFAEDRQLQIEQFAMPGELILA